MATNDFDEYQDKMEAKIEGLKSFTMKTLGEIKCEVNALGKRINGWEELIAAVTDKELPAICNSVVTLEEDLRELRGKVPVDTQPSAKKNIFAPTSSKKTRVEQPEKVPVCLEEIRSSELRQAVQPYYKVDCSPGVEKLTPAQLAYVNYFFKVVKGGEYSARSEVITELIQSGTKDKMWYDGFKPDGIKGQFAAYMKEKVRNLSKKRLSEIAANEFAMAFAENI